MKTSFEDQVREQAYHIWLSGGMADGKAHEHWALAEATVKATRREPVVIITKPETAKTETAKTEAAKKAATKVASKTAASKPIAKKSGKPAAKKMAKTESASIG